MVKKRAKILSVGTAVPDRIVTNKDLEKIMDTTDEWITSRSGITQRHICDPESGLTAHELGTQAARVALQRAELTPADIDGIICATFTPDNFFPSTACLISRNLGCPGVVAFDISAACAGFIYGLTVANSLIASGQCRRILLVGSELISRVLDWNDRTTSILFGDGAGAIILEASDRDEVGIQSTYLSSDGSLSDILNLPAFGEKRFLSMKGQEVFKNAVRLMYDAIARSLEACTCTSSDVDLVIPHQANIRIIKALAEKLGLPIEKVVINLENYGNTSSASIPLALNEAWTSNRINPGTRVVFAALGGGITVGSAYVIF